MFIGEEFVNGGDNVSTNLSFYVTPREYADQRINSPKSPAMALVAAYYGEINYVTAFQQFNRCIEASLVRDRLESKQQPAFHRKRSCTRQDIHHYTGIQSQYGHRQAFMGNTELRIT